MSSENSGTETGRFTSGNGSNVDRTPFPTRHWPRRDDNWDVREFHMRFRVPVRQLPQALTPDESDFRIKFLQEELDEYKQAVLDGDLAKQFDALIDLVYVAHGTALMQGFPWSIGWDRVQRANMAKVLGTDIGREGRHAFDVVKPEGWTSPDLTDIVECKTIADAQRIVP